MAGASVFDWVCERLEEATSLDRLEARGTLRLALKSAGLEARGATRDQMRVVLSRLLPGELASRGVEDGEGVCTRLAQGLDSAPVEEPSSSADTPDAVFARLGG